MELSGLTLDIAALPWPGFVLITVLVFFIVWYLMIFKKTEKEYFDLKEEHHIQTTKILEQLDKIQDKIVVFQTELSILRNDLNNIGEIVRNINLSNVSFLEELQRNFSDRLSTLEDNISDEFCSKLESVKNAIQNTYFLRHRD